MSHIYRDIVNFLNKNTFMEMQYILSQRNNFYATIKDII